jgi:hypothetical protein
MTSGFVSPLATRPARPIIAGGPGCSVGGMSVPSRGPET